MYTLMYIHTYIHTYIHIYAHVYIDRHIARLEFAVARYAMAVEHSETTQHLSHYNCIQTHPRIHHKSALVISYRFWCNTFENDLKKTM